MLGAILAVASVSVGAGVSLAPPEWTRAVALAVVGWHVGGQVRGLGLGRLGSPVIAALITTFVFAATTVGLSLALIAAGVGSPPTALLMSAPGGLSFTAALSIGVGGDTSLVTATHLLRVFFVVTVIPALARRMRTGGRRS